MSVCLHVQGKYDCKLYYLYQLGAEAGMEKQQVRSCFQKNIKKIHSILLCKCKSGNKKSATRCLPLLINWRQKRDGKIPGQIFSRRKIELHNQHLGRDECGVKDFQTFWKE